MSSDIFQLTLRQVQVQKIFDLIWMELRQNGGVNFLGPLNQTFSAKKLLDG